jgi:hypothetical protein
MKPVFPESPVFRHVTRQTHQTLTKFDQTAVEKSVQDRYVFDVPASRPNPQVRIE